MPRLGLLLSCLPILLTACASGPVRTQTVDVQVPVYVPIDSRLTATVGYMALAEGQVTTGMLAESYDSCRKAVATANSQFGEIQGLQKKGPPEQP
jgi:hypothetical protein